MMVEILDVICCPACQGELSFDSPKKEKLYCKRCSREYQVKNGIPILLLEKI